MNFGTCVKPRVSGCIHPLIGRHGEEANLRMMHFLFEIALKNFPKNVLIVLTSSYRIHRKFAPFFAQIFAKIFVKCKNLHKKLQKHLRHDYLLAFICANICTNFWVSKIFVQIFAQLFAQIFRLKNIRANFCAII